MALDFLNDPTRATLKAALNACAERGSVIANNIANADTPGFKRSKVEFEEALRDLLDSPGAPDPAEVESLRAKVQTDETPSGRLDGNNVNIDTEMADLARNSIQYSALIELYKMKGQLLSTVISGGTK